VEIVEEVCFQGGQRDNAKTAEKLVFARVVLPARPQSGVTEVVFNSRDGRPFGMYAPIQLSRPAKLVFAWDAGMSFARGSAIYFRTPTTNGAAHIRVPYARWSTPHSLALLDTNDTIRAMEQWFPPERPGNIMLTTQLQPAERGQVWCCLQGLSKSMVIEPGDEHIPPFFADRPERFFLPQDKP